MDVSNHVVGRWQKRAEDAEVNKAEIEREWHDGEPVVTDRNKRTSNRERLIWLDNGKGIILEAQGGCIKTCLYEEFASWEPLKRRQRCDVCGTWGRGETCRGCNRPLP